MASFTTDYNLANANWTQVSTNKNVVLIYNSGSLPVYYAVAAASGDLTSVTGHVLDSRKSIKIDGLGTTSQNVFIRSGNSSGGASASVSAY